jgi:probable rRNA maturation factor
MSNLRSGRVQATQPAVTIIIEEPMWRDDKIVIPSVRRAARLAMTAICPGKTDRLAVSILLATDKRLRLLNAAFRDQRRTTNVLSFPALPDQSPYFGDVALGYGIISREALVQNKRFAQHAAHLTVHGILHLAGYDHQCQADAATMETLEISLLARMGIPNPYVVMPVRHTAKRHKLTTCLRIPAR